MNAVIILPGAQVEPADIVIGVNTAVPGCTHAIALDLPAYSSIEPLPGVKRILSATTVQQSQQQTGEIPQHDGQVEDLFKAYPRTVPWSAHTLTAALVLAASLGAKQIEVIGLDEASDIEGSPLPEAAEGESPVRHDLIILDQTVKYLEAKGVEIDLGNSSDSITLPSEDGETPTPAA